MAASTTILLSSYPKAITANGKATLAELFTLAEAKAAFPDAFRAMLVMRGWTDAQVMGLALFNALYTDAVWRGVDPNATAGQLTSRNTVVCDLHGAWWMNDYLYYSFGTYRFTSSGTGNAAYNGDLGGFEILHWADNWKGPATNRAATVNAPLGERVLFSAFHSGSDSLFAYSEGTAFEGGFRMHGGCGNFRDMSKPRVVGFEAWDFGEASGFERIFPQYCDCGKRIARGTPFNASHTVSSFSNTECGLELMGVGNARFSTISVDDNPRSIQTVAGYGRPNTSNVKVDVIKSEWAVTPKNQGRTWKPQTISLSGKFKWKVDMITHASGAWGNAMFMLSPDAGLGPSALIVDIVDVFSNAGTEMLVHDTVAGVAWKFDARVVSFKWTNAMGTSDLETWPAGLAAKVTATHKNQLGYFDTDPVTGKNSGVFDRVAGTPTWSDVTGNGGTATVPVPPPTVPPVPVPLPTPLALAWATTFAGTQPRTAVATTGASVTVSQPWQGFARIGSGNASTQENTQFPLSILQVRRIVLRGLTLATPVRDWSVLNSCLKVRTDGTITAWDGFTVLNKVRPGGKADVTIDFATPVDVTHVLGMVNQPCAIMTLEQLEIYK